MESFVFGFRNVHRIHTFADVFLRKAQFLNKLFDVLNNVSQSILKSRIMVVLKDGELSGPNGVTTILLSLSRVKIQMFLILRSNTSNNRPVLCKQ